MPQPQWPVSLFYRPKWRKDEAQRIAAGLDKAAGVIRFREARHFDGPGDVEFKIAKVNQPPVNYDRVLVLKGSPNADLIVAEYAEWGVKVEVVSEDAPPPDKAPLPPNAPPKPDYRKMTKAKLRAAALEQYGKNLPVSMKVKELREWLEGQPWPPLVTASASPEDEV